MDEFQQFTMPGEPDYFTQGFWPELVKRVATIEPAVQHALNSLGAAHLIVVERQGTGSSTVSAASEGNSPHQIALQQYNAAITQLARIMATRGTCNTEIILVCCFLFVCIETLFGNLEAARKHCEAGLKVYRNWLSNPNLDQEEESHTLSSSNPRYCIWRLAAELEEILEDLNDPTLAKMDLLSIETEDPWRFDSNVERFLSAEHISSALLFLHRKLKYLIHATAAHQAGNQSLIPNVVLQQHHNLGILYAAFESPYHRFMSELLREDVDRSILILQLRYISQSTIYGSVFGKIPQSTLATKFQDLLDTAELLLKGTPLLRPPPIDVSSSATTGVINQLPEGAQRTPSFVLCAETIPCLSHAAKAAPTFQLRQRAISLLRRSNTVEGIWNSLTVAKLAEELLEADL